MLLVRLKRQPVQVVWGVGDYAHAPQPLS
jgi:hypothetical protein